MLSANDLLEEAKTLADLHDYGDLGFTEGLQVLIDSINREAGLTASNEAALKLELLRVLVNRLRMQHDIVLHPEILDEEILPPIFITSLPRTGSTKLHRMMGATGDFNAMTFWQAYHFGRFPGMENVTPDPRIADADRYLQWLYRRAPLFQQCHPMYTQEVEEELSLLDACFNTLYRYAVLLNVPSYVAWVLGGDGLRGICDLRRMLQYLQWQHFRGRQRRWVLKTPSLFGQEASLAQVFPGMDFIVTHRHPLENIGSAFDLLRGVRQLYYEQHVSNNAMAGLLYNFVETFKAHAQWRESYPAEKVLDLRFKDIARDEFGVLDKVYSFLGMQPSATAKANVRAWIDMDKHRGEHRAKSTLADYGIAPEMVTAQLAPYIERYQSFL